MGISLYDRTRLCIDIIAGLTTAVVVVSSGLAYASLAGLLIQAGLYTALRALKLICAAGKSPVLSSA